MVHLGNWGCFFYDACVLLAQVLSEKRFADNLRLLETDASRNGIPCFISDHTRKECSKVLTDLEDFHGNLIREASSHLLSRRIQEPPETDIKELILKISEFFHRKFAEVKKKAEREDIGRTETERLLDKLRAIRDWMHNYARERLDKGETKVKLETYFQDLLSDLMKSSERNRNKLSELIIQECQQTSSACETTVKKKLKDAKLLRDKDATLVAIAYNHQSDTDKWTIVVSLDFNMTNRHRKIWEACHIQCSEPIDAIFHLERLFNEYQKPTKLP